MQDIERVKFVNHVYPTGATLSAATALTIANLIDMRGWGHLRVLMQFGTVTVAMTAAPKLQHCDTTDGTFEDITGAVLSAAPSATADGLQYAIDVDLMKGTAKRYAKIVGTKGTDATTGTELGVIGILSKKHQGTFAGAAAEAGLTEKISA